MITTADLINYCGVVHKLYASRGEPPPLMPDTFIHEHGRTFSRGRKRLPEAQVHAKNKACYWNARLYMQRRSRQVLTYCEGYVGWDGCPIPIMHGWCVDADGVVHDPSVENVLDTVYFGVEFQPEFADRLWTFLRARGAIGIFPNWYLHRTAVAEMQAGVSNLAALQHRSSTADSTCAATP